MKKNITHVLLWILCIGSLTAMSSHASPAASAEIPLLNHPHPRLLLFKGEEEGIKQMIASHPEWQKMHNLILRECDVLLQGPDLERKLQGANMLKVSREMWKRAFYLSYAYRMTGDKRYARKVERDMLSVCRFSDWNPQHCLDGAEMTMGVAFGYDWLYDELSESSRKLIREAIAEKGMRHALEDNRYNWWRKVGGNANQVCNSGLGIGAIAVYEDFPELSKKLIEQAFTSLPVALKTLAPDGIFPEGYGYWNFGMTYNVFFFSAVEKLGGSDRGLLSMPGVLRSADFAKHSITPIRSNFNWADQNEWIIINPSMFWLAKKIGNLSVLWSEKIFLEHPTFYGYQNLRELPAIMIWAKDIPLDQITEPKEKFWMGQGSNPIAMMRSSWKSRDAIYLGFKAGTPFEIHGHMDVGSFIMEADGYRWASDPGTHNYWLTDSLGINTQSKDPNTQRWIVFRYNNHSHNVITVNGQLQKHKGYAKIDEYSDREEFMYAISDLTDAYNGEVKKGVRGVALKDGKYIVIRDEIETLDNGKPTTIRWKMLSYCDVQLAERSATLNPTKALEKNRKITGKKLTMKVSSSTDIKMKQWSTATGKPYDLPMPGSVQVGFECTIPAGTKATFEVLLIPEKSTDLATFLHKDLSEWKTINNHTPPAVVPVSKLTLDKQSVTLSKGETTTLKAIVEPANATNKDVTWSSDKPAIATVDATGRLTAKTAGVAVISVKSKADPTKQATCTVTVTEPAKLSVSPANISLQPDKDKQKIKLTSNRSWKASSSVTWLTLSATSGTGSGSITVTASPNPSEKNPRTGKVTITAEGLTQTVTCTQKARPTDIKVSKLTLDKQNVKLPKGETTTLKATVEPANATNKNVTWRSNKPAIATVDATGRVTAKTAGVAVISVKSKADPTKQATCTVTVTEPAKLSVSPANISLRPDKDKQKIKITSNRSWKASSSVTWLTLSATSGTGSGSITVTASPNPSEKNPRTGKVTITAEGLTQTVTCTQKARPTNIKVSKLTLDKQSVKLLKGETTMLKAIVEPANATNKSVTWSSSAPDIAEVNNGRVTAIAAGVATISAKTVDGGLTASCQIIVTDETTGNSEMLTPQVYAVPGAVRIVLPYPETVYIFSLDALRIHVLLLRAGEHVEALPPGAYAVKIRKESYKIFIRNR